MITEHWSLFGLRLRTPQLELRLPDLEDLAQLADVAAAGVHDPAVMPFVTAWTDTTAAGRARSTLQWAWTQAGRCYVDDGSEWHVVQGRRVRGRRLLLDREHWAAARTIDVTITGLEPCLEQFGVPTASAG
ncbi:hypothetical protein [Actinoplanes sp. NPDC051859]|uniref:hypothetical protein n=1 Tax=Actinoplanes sp. NPDC051859 TaxID=3363909 RepID=UPI0037B801BD